MNVTIIIWLTAAILYAFFYLWYRGLGRPLSAEEINKYDTLLAKVVEPEMLAEWRKFLQKDDGREFFMMNLVQLRDEPLPVEGVPEGTTTQQMLRLYMSGFFLRELVKRACWQVFQGIPRAGALEKWQVEPAARWSAFMLMRYRSRRDFLAIVTHPKFQAQHPFKVAAIEATYAMPTRTLLTLAPPLVMALLVVAGAGLVHILIV